MNQETWNVLLAVLIIGTMAAVYVFAPKPQMSASDIKSEVLAPTSGAGVTTISKVFYITGTKLSAVMNNASMKGYNARRHIQLVFASNSTDSEWVLLMNGE